jgi:hypothetical protein
MPNSSPTAPDFAVGISIDFLGRLVLVAMGVTNRGGYGSSLNRDHHFFVKRTEASLGA